MIKSFFFAVFLMVGCAVFCAPSEGFVVAFEGEPLFYLSHDALNESAKKRAEEASKLLNSAILSSDGQSESPLVETKSEDDGSYSIYVRGEFVSTLYEKDAINQGEVSLDKYKEKISAKLKGLVSDEIERQKWQSNAMKIFFSAILILLSAVFFQLIKSGFDRVKSVIIRKARWQGIRILGLSLFRGEGFRGVLVILIEITRWISYVTAFLVILATLLSQFKATRNFVSLGGKTLADTFIGIFSDILTSIPGIILSLLILFFLYIGINALNLVIDRRNTVDKNASWHGIPRNRLSAGRRIIPLALLALFLPLSVAAFFHRFGTPLEWFIVGLGLILALSSIVVLANWCAGIALLWKNTLHAGQYIKAGKISGEIIDIGPMFMVLVPKSGGQILLPSLHIFLYGYYVLPKKNTVYLTVENEKDFSGKFNELKERYKKISPELSFTIKNIGPKNVRIAFEMSFDGGDKQEMFHLLLANGLEPLKLLE